MILSGIVAFSQLYPSAPVKPYDYAMPVAELKIHSPCLGICSTTYGDQVCRGCKRYCHEITDWLSYDSVQKHQVWQRLENTAQQVLDNFLRIDNPVLLQQSLQTHTHRSYPPQTDYYTLLLLLHHLTLHAPSLPSQKLFEPAAFGLQWQIGTAPITLYQLWQKIDQQLLSLTIALYDRQIERPMRICSTENFS